MSATTMVRRKGVDQQEAEKSRLVHRQATGPVKGPATSQVKGTGTSTATSWSGANNTVPSSTANSAAGNARDNDNYDDDAPVVKKMRKTKKAYSANLAHVEQERTRGAGSQGESKQGQGIKQGQGKAKGSKRVRIDPKAKDWDGPCAATQLLDLVTIEYFRPREVRIRTSAELAAVVPIAEASSEMVAQVAHTIRSIVYRLEAGADHVPTCPQGGGKGSFSVSRVHVPHLKALHNMLLDLPDLHVSDPQMQQVE
jgi:hypothetical protein